MKKTITFLIVILSVLSLKAQVELIRNGDFSQGVPGASGDLIKEMAFWSMDMESPASGWWSEHAGLTSTDTTLYQVVETISTDSVLYTLSFNVTNTWISDKIIAIASVTGADSTIRTRIASGQFVPPLDVSTNFEFKFGFSKDSPHAGKRLVIEFDLTSLEAGGAWANLDNVSMKKVIAGVNSAPVAVTGPPQTVKGGDLVTLDASASNDFEGSPLTYKWVSVYPGISLSDKTAVSPTFTAPDVTELTTFEFTLFVSDGELNSDTVIASVTVSPAGELIRNGGFELFKEGSDPASTSLLDVASWNIDTAGVLSGGRYGTTGLRFLNPASIDPPIYQVVKTIGANEASYTLSFSARSSWNSSAIKAIISVSDADSSIRTEINSFDAVFAIDVPNGISTTTMKVFTFVFVIPANSEYAGKKLILEFDNIPYADGTDNGWAEMDNVSLIESSSSSVNSKAFVNTTIYPNPASDRVYIQSASKINRVDIYSVPGSLEKSFVNDDIRQVEIGDLSKGLHFICLTSNSGRITKKFQVK
jgi:hypothetical protein